MSNSKLLLKFTKSILFLAGAIAILGIAWAMALNYLPPIEKSDSVYIPRVDFQADSFQQSDNKQSVEELSKASAKFEELKTPIFKSNFHWLKEGNQTAVFYGNFSGGNRNTMDDETFQKVTVVLPSIEPGTYQIDGKNVKGYFSKGGSAWPSAQCGSPIRSGELRIAKDPSGNIIANLKFQVVCKTLMDRQENISFEKKFKLSKLAFNEALPWHGKKGKSILKETYR